MFGLFDGAGLSGSDKVRLRRLERKIDLIMQHLGLEYDTGLSEEVRRLADSGNKIAAIKQLREETGAGLADAKQTVEEYLGSQSH